MSEREEGERVQKILSRAGIASRRGSERLIAEGRVTLNGRTATPGDRAVAGRDEILVDDIPVNSAEQPRYFALNKPAGVVTTASDPQGRLTVLDMVGDELKGEVRLFPVGRLDMDSTGLILLTNDGFLANRLTHPRYEVQREYLVVLEPVPSAADLARLRKGVELEDGNTGEARVSLVGKLGDTAQVGMTIHTGRKRQIRRSFEALGYRVLELCRVRIGRLGLGLLGPGEMRELTADEVRELYRLTGIDG